MIVDSHCHLNEKKFKEANLSVADLIAEAAASGVEILNTICTNHPEFEEIQAIVNAHKNVFCTYGIHPHHAEEMPITTEDIIHHASATKVIGLGETGLDYFYENSPKKAQAKSFHQHCEAAQETLLPLVIHTRDAEKDTAQILEKYLKTSPLPLVLHCFSSNAWLADWGREYGTYFSASGLITFKKNDDIRESFRQVPTNRLLVETDAPYLAPHPHRGKICTPAYTAITLQCLADIHEVTAEKMATITTKNFFSLFPKAKLN